MLARGYFDHGAFAQRIRGYARLRKVGETLAMSPRCNASRTVGMWMNSSSHRRVLLRGALPPGRHRAPCRRDRLVPDLHGHGRLRLAALADARSLARPQPGAPSARAAASRPSRA